MRLLPKAARTRKPTRRDPSFETRIKRLTIAFFGDLNVVIQEIWPRRVCLLRIKWGTLQSLVHCRYQSDIVRTNMSPSISVDRAELMKLAPKRENLPSNWTIQRTVLLTTSSPAWSN